MRTIIFVPGLHNSGPDHWQSRWQQQLPDSRRAEQHDWDTPDLDAWTDAVSDALRGSDGAWLIAHSFGCLASVQAAVRNPASVRGLFLVAPADPEKFGIAGRLPQAALPVPGLMVTSTSDPWLSVARANLWARRWRLPVLDAGDAGHINAESGHGNWPRGWFWFQLWQPRAAQRQVAVSARHNHTVRWHLPSALSSTPRSSEHGFEIR